MSETTLKDNELNNFSKEKSTLIYKINALTSLHLQHRYDELTLLLKDNTINEEERQEFIKLNEQMEQYSADRLRLLMHLAKLRKLTVLEVMTQLGLQKPVYV